LIYWSVERIGDPRPLQYKPVLEVESADIKGREELVAHSDAEPSCSDIIRRHGALHNLTKAFVDKVSPFSLSFSNLARNEKWELLSAIELYSYCNLTASPSMWGSASHVGTSWETTVWTSR
jgi:hypothetical protein